MDPALLDLWKTIPGHFNFEAVYDRVVEKFPNGAAFVEVGSYVGCSAAYLASRIMASGKSISLHCVDVWLDRTDMAPGKDLDQLFVEYTRPFQGIITPVKAPSLEACRMFPDKSLDFVFIDADHTYEACKEDILHWRPKLKDGGLLAGHDYTAADDPDKSFEGVGRAVREIFGTGFEVHQNSWIRR